MTTGAAVGDLVRERRDELAGMYFALWVVTGLFLDGWAHQNDKVETFWTPWHAVLYSGFLAAAGYAVVTGLLARRRGGPFARDSLVTAGFGLFFLGGVGDSAWHSVFGVEQELEGLLSPSHLFLMLGGLLLTTSPVRVAWSRPERAPSLRKLLPTVVGATLSVSIVGFFTHFASPFVAVPAYYREAPTDELVALAVAGVFWTTTLLMGVSFTLLVRWELPRGALFVLFTGFASLMSVLRGLEEWQLILSAAAAGAVADLMVRQGASRRLIGIVVPGVLWSVWFATYGAVWGLDWSHEMWSGAIMLASLIGYGLSYLAQPAVALPRPAVPTLAEAGRARDVRSPG